MRKDQAQSSPLTKKKKKKKAQTQALFSGLFHSFFFFEVLANKTTMGVRESLPTFAGCIFFSLSSPFRALRQGIIGFRCAGRCCFSALPKKKMHKGVDGAITATAVEWF